MANSVYPDEMAHDEPSHLDLHCLQRYLLGSASLQGLSDINYTNLEFGVLTRVSSIISGQFLVPAERKSTLSISKSLEHI